MLKACIAKNCFSMLYVDLSVEERLLLGYPKALPAGFKISPHLVEIRLAEHKTIELLQAIAICKVLLPSALTPLRSSLNILAETRNASLHSLVPTIDTHKIESIAVLALKLYQLLKERGDLGYVDYKLTDRDNGLLSAHDQEAVERVRKKLAAAKLAAKKGREVDVSVDHDWQLLEVRCPVCESIGIAEGTTEPDSRDVPRSLIFWVDKFECEGCGLMLDDSDEIRLAGMEPGYERDDDLDRWERRNDIFNPED